MLTKILKMYESVVEWLPIVVGLIVAAEAEQGEGGGSDKKKSVLTSLSDVLDDNYVWIKEDWAQRAMSCVVDLVVWLLNKKPDWVKALGKLANL